jgi:hypothetical protein
MTRLGPILAALVWTVLTAQAALAADLEPGGKLLLTRGVASVEGTGGGGLATWALITGDETERGVGGEAEATYVALPNYDLSVFGAGVGLFDRFELTYARQSFQTGATGAKLGLGRNFTFDQDIVGAKLRLFGDAVYDQDSWLPQLAAGVQYKSNDRDAVIHAVGGRSAVGVDYYLAATKLFLNESLVLDATLRLTKANQFGLLGFGGDKTSGYSPEFEGSAGYLLTRRLLLGAEYRSKPNNLGFAQEDGAFDAFAAYALNHTLSVTAAYVDLGDIATFRNQRGLFFSIQAGF